MMRMQARESQLPVFGVRHPLRAYATNSPRAQARLVVLALLADGQLDEREIDALDRRGIFADLGIARSAFVEVLSDFCSDVADQLPVSGSGYQLTQKALAGMLDEVSDRRVRVRLLRHMLAVINSDGHLSDAEKSLICTAMEHWQSGRGGEGRLQGSKPLLS
nr:TerB family tellurite resistance protein [Dechloromonas sp.]